MRAQTKAQTREVVRQRYDFRCGYCASAEDEVGARLTIDHYRPRAEGGEDEDENLVYSCHACNEHKGDFWSEDAERRLLHPLQDDLAAHLAEGADHALIGLTERGRLHITILHLNRPELLASRRRRRRMAEADAFHREVSARLDAMEAEMRRLSAQIAQITGGISISPDDIEKIP